MQVEIDMDDPRLLRRPVPKRSASAAGARALLVALLLLGGTLAAVPAASACDEIACITHGRDRNTDAYCIDVDVQGGWGTDGCVSLDEVEWG